MASRIIDQTDLVEHAQHGRRGTGIQRVALAIGNAAIAAGATAGWYDEPFSIWKRVPLAELAALQDLTTRGVPPAGAEWRMACEAFQGACREAAPLEFQPGTILCSLGASWGRTGLLQSVRSLRERVGLRYAAFLHDTVPLDFPEFCEGDTPERFRQWFYDCVATADVLIANSKATAACVRRACSEIGFRCPPIALCRLDGVGERSAYDLHRPSEAIRRILNTRYVLFVATFEPRKNHLGVIAAWRTLCRDLGDDAPLLVLAGAHGWNVDLVLKALEDPRLRGKIVVASDVSDADLGALYRGCLFTIYNSFFEGWGLPVSESLACGKVPVVPAHSGLLESGADGATYFAPDDNGALARTALQLIQNPDLLAAKTSGVAAMRFPTWGEIAARLETDLAELFVGSEPLIPRMEIGTFYRFSKLIRGQRMDTLRSLSAALISRGAGWHYAEDWGSWTSSRTFEIKALLRDRAEVLETTCRDTRRLDEDLVVHLTIIGHHNDCELTFRSGDGVVLGTQLAVRHAEMKLKLIWPAHLGRKLDLLVDQTRLTDLAPASNGEDRREIGVGIVAMMVSRESDLAARCSFYESFMNVEAIDCRTC